MASTLNAALSAVVALLFWTCLGAAITRRILPGPLVLPTAPVVGWAVHSALALPLFRVVGFSQASVLVVAILALLAPLANLVALRRPPPDGADTGARVPGWAYAAAALLALPAAIALLPKPVADGVILAGPIFDHSKVAMIDEMARLGVPPGNPFFGEAGAPSRLVYYYLWHFSAAEIVVALGVSGWEADIAVTWFTAFSSLALMMGLAVRLGARRSAALWVIPLALAASLRPVLSLFWSAETLETVLLPDTGFAGWLFQSAWVPQHLMSACCVVVATVLMSALAQGRGVLRIVVLALVAAAAFESSTWVGGVTFALAAPLVGAGLLIAAAPGRRGALLVRLAAASVLTACVAAPFLYDQIAAAATRGEGSPIVLAPYEVLGDVFSDRLRRILDLPAFWLVLLVVELPAIYLPGIVAAGALLARRTLDRARWCDALALGLLAAAGLAVSWLLASTLGGNNDLGWRAVLPPVLALTAFTAAGLSQWIAARTWIAVAAAVGAICLGLPRSVEIIRDNATGHMQPDAKAFAQAPELWAAVRRHAAADERVGNNPLFLRAVAPWPINISWALMSSRRSCFAGREFALVFTPLPAAQREAVDAQFIRVFAGEGSAEDVRDLATRYGCRVVALTSADGAWMRDPFATSPLYRLVETAPDRWRIYRAVPSGDDAPRR
jgi:hypothetical protein